jgi:flagella basal body P-ring formation protein FlgA
MNRWFARAVLLCGVAALALVAFVALTPFTCGCAPPVHTGEPGTVDVVIAIVDIPVGTVIEPSMVTKQTILASAAEPGAFHDPAQVIGEAARHFIKAGSQMKVPTTGGAPPLPSSSP